MIRSRRAPGTRLVALAAVTIVFALGCAIATAATARHHHGRVHRGPVLLRPGRLPGPSSMSLGLVDHQLFLLSSGPTRDMWLARARALGSSFVRISAYWRQIAPFTRPPGFDPSNPADPNYDFSTLDSAVRAATANGENVVLLAGWAPDWAEAQPIPAGILPGAWEPNAAELGHFATALALRYSGHFRPVNSATPLPRVSFLQAWNEPNLPRYLMPQWSQDTTTGALVPTSPGIYRSLLNSFFAGVKAVAPADTVLAAGLGPYGDPPGAPRDQMYPVTFLQTLLCLDANLRPAGSCPKPAHFDAWDHHPYGASPTLKARNAGDVAVPDLGRLWRIMHAAQHFNLALPAGPKPLWVTELDWSDVPPAPPTSAHLALQARFLSLGFYELWRQGVSHIFWFQLRDPTNQPNSFSGGGLYLVSGAAKPAAAAYRFPFIAIPAHHGRLTIWGRAPAPGPVVIEQRVGRHWRRVLQLTANADGIFYANYSLGYRLYLRAVAGASVSPVWATIGRM